MDQVQADITNLVFAVQAYRTEYNRFPRTEHTDEKKPVPLEKRFLQTLTGIDIPLNPRQITFFEGTTQADGKLKKITGSSAPDPWGQAYRLHIDWNNDRAVDDPKHPGKIITASVLVYSAGPDGKYETWGDNVTSWK